MAMPVNPLETFIWGEGGARKTPEEIAREREIAEALMQGGIDTSPVGHWLEGAARMAQSGVGAFRDWRASQAQGQNQTESAANIATMLGGGLAEFPQAPQSVSGLLPQNQASVAPAEIPQSADASYIREGLIKRGLPGHVADAFVVNFKDESGLNPGINEAAPIVPGSRGGFGLYQLTGPRRREYEAFAAQKGVPVADTDAQLDFLMTELGGSESRAAKNILSAPDTATAAQAVLNDFLRPAPEHRASRGARYARLGNSAQAAPVQDITQSPVADIPAPQRQMNQAVIQALSNPYASPQERQIATMLMGRQYEEQDRAAQLAARNSDPLRQLQIQQAQIELQQAQQPKSQALMNAGDGRIYNPNTGEWIAAPGTGNPEFRKATPEEAATYGAAGGQFGPDGRFYPINPPAGMSIESTPEGGFRMVQGPGAQQRPLTEGQSKDTVFATRAAGALPLLDQFGSALVDPVQRAMDMDPTGLVRGQQTPEFQQARQAADEFLQAILRKDTGAAITSEEMGSYGKTYLPGPGDGPELLAQKKAARARALNAIKAGMPPQAILNQEKALSESGAPKASKPISEMTDEELEAIANGNG